MRDVDSLRYRDWVPYWAVAFLAGYLWATSGPDLTWRRVAAIVLCAFGGLAAHGIRALLLRVGGGRYAYKHGYTCPCGRFTFSTNDRAAYIEVRDQHRDNCEAFAHKREEVSRG